ncbi:phasin-related domain-containing protein [Photobacterium minamisatsumaniensis]|uniref:phasin-related domain-containing protein n=1 Tax=Photobacterium minamisatsumaniensis TaxID=2910233 RepID=UPI003D147DFC
MINPMKMMDSVKSVTQVGEASVRNVVLAGLGAYSKGYEQAGMAQHMLTKRFNDLVDRGGDVETELTERVHNTKKMVFGRAESQMNQAINTTCGIDRDRMSDFEEKIDRLQAAVEKLTEK